MARIIVDVMPKPEILDPQGKAVHGALPRLGFESVSDVRQGKRFELQVALADESTLAEVHQIAASRSRCGTATTTSRASTRSSCPAASPTATTCAAVRSPASRRS